MLTVHRSMLSLVVMAVFAPAAWGQRAAGSTRDSLSELAAQLLNAGRSNEARILLLKAVRDNGTPGQRAVYRLEVGDSYLYDGLYTEATRTYNQVLASGDTRGVDSLSDWVHHSLGLVEAFNGRNTRAAGHFAAALKTRASSDAALSDSIRVLVLTSQHDAAAAALDRYGAANSSPQGQQFAYALRGLNSMLAGHCTDALAALAKAPVQDRPIPRAVRARCAAKHGELATAIAIRDSVLKQPVPDPFAWNVLVARDIARKVH